MIDSTSMSIKSLPVGGLDSAASEVVISAPRDEVEEVTAFTTGGASAVTIGTATALADPEGGASAEDAVEFATRVSDGMGNAIYELWFGGGIRSRV